MTHSGLYRGTLVHARRDAFAERTFRYPAYLASIDLAELPALDAGLRLFSHGGCNLFALHDRDYTNAATGGLAAEHARVLAAHELPRAHAVRLVTNLRTLGYVFNPVSFFLGYGDGGALETAVAEVNNTYGGRHRYVLGPRDRLPDRGRRVGFRQARELFVSPFLHGPAAYEFWFDAPLDGAALDVTMHVDRLDTGDRVFVAKFTGARASLTDRALAAAALRYPLMAVQVTALIHVEALKLHLRGVPYRRPGPDHRPHPAIDPA